MPFSRRTLPALCLLGCSALFAAETGLLSPFLGKWELDKTKSQVTGAPEDLRLEIKKDGNKGVVINSRYREPKSAIYPLLWVGIMTYELPLSTDGSEKTNHIGPFTHVSKTSVEGKTMQTDFTAALDKGNVTGRWVRTVSDDGREMTLHIQSKASDGRNLDQKLVFKRK
jgi:hypothetical protein